MYALINLDSMTPLARHKDFRALAALHYIVFPNVEGGIVKLGENRPLAAFDQQQLYGLANSVGYHNPTEYEYGTLIRLVRAQLETIDWMDVPYSTHELDSIARSIAPHSDQPAKLPPPGGSMALTWVDSFALPSGDLTRYTGRRDISTFAYCFSPTCATMDAPNPGHTSNHGDIDMATASATKKAPAKKVAKAAPAAPKKAAPAKKAAEPRQRDEQNGIARPRAGTSSANVWDIADTLSKKNKQPAKHGEVLEQAAAAGINEATAKTQFARWRTYHGIVGRAG